MSRTDKDRPEWVRKNDPTERRIPYHRHDGYQRWAWVEAGDCRIDDEYTREDGWRRPCGYYLAYRWYDRPTKAFRNLNFYAPQRLEERLALLEATKQYNSGEEVDEDIVLVEQHRHSLFGGGYWD